MERNERTYNKEGRSRNPLYIMKQYKNPSCLKEGKALSHEYYH
jgi:hypothetical protein